MISFWLQSYNLYKADIFCNSLSSMLLVNNYIKLYNLFGFSFDTYLSLCVYDLLYSLILFIHRQNKTKQNNLILFFSFVICHSRAQGRTLTFRHTDSPLRKLHIVLKVRFQMIVTNGNYVKRLSYHRNSHENKCSKLLAEIVIKGNKFIEHIVT